MPKKQTTKAPKTPNPAPAAEPARKKKAPSAPEAAPKKAEAAPKKAEAAPKKAEPAMKKAEPAPKKAAASDAPLALRLAVLEDVVRRSSQETRAFGAKLDTFAASQTELARRVADVEKRAS